ncbi:hypothetical protein AB205_0165500 [Aquarana catesbeiana]|uniref:E3 ubiquitin-protein ligase n=2 Tax=Aquarana catesbeiana TaxID=8400 RepID=A0A2G9SF84_AQUCT|nr:hypothetical protein AB205_0165500 [Aquarana catesbeiana]PIO38787.1 hypothetical protein AB205_0165500 [Aquarana catesbeiana]
MLITEENLMTIIIRTFMDHLRHRDVQGRFQFERYTALQAFKFRRVQSLVLDLKYLLISKPPEWSSALRFKFLEGFYAFLELLKCMQGMDPITRQVGQHIEMEPEWEAAFTLQMKLTHIISMMQDWCSIDEHVLIEAYKKCLEVLTHCHGGFTDGEQPITLSMAGHSVDTIRYCVSQEKVSIHLPVSRLLAGLHALLSKSEVAYKCPELLPFSELSPPMLIEHPLRCLVLCAQVHAGMWRRNGFSLVNQIYYYHNVKCRREMFDKDIVMLQGYLSFYASVLGDGRVKMSCAELQREYPKILYWGKPGEPDPFKVKKMCIYFIFFVAGACKALHKRSADCWFLQEDAMNYHSAHSAVILFYNVACAFSNEETKGTVSADSQSITNKLYSPISSFTACYLSVIAVIEQDFLDIVQQNNTLIEEMLHLIIMIVAAMVLHIGSVMTPAISWFISLVEDTSKCNILGRHVTGNQLHGTRECNCFLKPLNRWGSLKRVRSHLQKKKTPMQIFPHFLSDKTVSRTLMGNLNGAQISLITGQRF